MAGASVSVVARQYDVNANCVFKWRRELAVDDLVVGVFAEVDKEEVGDSLAVISGLPRDCYATSSLPSVRPKHGKGFALRSIE